MGGAANPKSKLESVIVACDASEERFPFVRLFRERSSLSILCCCSSSSLPSASSARTLPRMEDCLCRSAARIISSWRVTAISRLWLPGPSLEELPGRTQKSSEVGLRGGVSWSADSLTDSRRKTEWSNAIRCDSCAASCSSNSKSDGRRTVSMVIARAS
ncbi:hypothetical protein TCAP_04507 [Tolypocladium capitatum]|uniref:Uncharacterized protein n=1 Tax=Tolypocladium capitatum TaxID=45235 RepID=A0A2K3QDD0_9HYPO|nr:hypothetical protein TCAP_04507 [Tolypocladium capitatum]